MGLEVDLSDTGGKLLEKTRVDFVSPQVDPTLQGILVKRAFNVPRLDIVRNAQMIKARVIWSTKPMAVVPVLAVTRQGGQTFVFVAREQGGHVIAAQTPVVLGDTVGNTYAITSGLNAGDKVIVSSTQFLVNGMPGSCPWAPEPRCPSGSRRTHRAMCLFLNIRKRVHFVRRLFHS